MTPIAAQRSSTPELGDSGLYTALGDIDALQARQRSEHLMCEVINFAKPPRALLGRLSVQPLVLSRHIASPNLELLRFLALADAVGRPPLITQSSRDWFTPSVNLSKRRLAKLHILRHLHKPDSTHFRTVRVVPFGSGRERLCDLRCYDGTRLLDFHHRLLAEFAGPAALEAVFDYTEFVGEEAPRAYYERAFALYICFGALAESFLQTGREQGFTESVVLPAFDAVVRRFGAKPAITPLLPVGDEEDGRWESYPAGVLRHAIKAARA